MYGPAGIGFPPMSVPHLDYRLNYNKKDSLYYPEASLLFGPYATATTKDLKHATHSFFETFKGEDGKINKLKLPSFSILGKKIDSFKIKSDISDYDKKKS